MYDLQIDAGTAKTAVASTSPIVWHDACVKGKRRGERREGGREREREGREGGGRK